MSTELPKSEKKKDKKDKSEKKRKREQIEEVVATEEPTLKKKKKDRKSSSKETAETNGVDQHGEESVKKSEADPVPAKADAKSQPQPQKSSQPTTNEKKPKKRSTNKPSQSSSPSPSPFVQLTESFYITLSPCANKFPLEGACAEHISPLLLTYYAPFNGVVLSYANPRLSEHPQGFKEKNAAKTILAKSVDEYGVTFVWLTADFVIFRPSKGTAIDGYVSLQNESVLGLVCYNYFNAAIERQYLPEEWKWTGDNRGEGGEAEGFYVDGEGKKVKGKISFRVTDFKADLNTNTISVGGTLLPEGKTSSVPEASGSKKKKKQRTMATRRESACMDERHENL